MSKKITFISIGLIVLFVVAYLLLSPYLVLNKIKKHAEMNNEEAISTYIDFPSVRHSLKDQMKQKLDEPQINSEGAEKDSFAELGNLLAIAIIEKFIDTAVTPQNITLLLQGKKLENPFESDKPSKNENESDSSKHELSYNTSYKSFNRFQVDIKKSNPANPDVSIIMTRDGLSWKITEVILHENEKESASQDVKQESVIEEPQKVAELTQEAPKVKYESLRISKTEIGNGDFYLPDPAEDKSNAIFYLTPAGMDNILEQVLEDHTLAGFIVVEKAYKFDDKYVLVISTGEYGRSCPATTYVIGYDTNSNSVSGVKKFESCSESIEAITEDNKLTVKKDDEALIFYDAAVG